MCRADHTGSLVIAAPLGEAVAEVRSSARLAARADISALSSSISPQLRVPVDNVRPQSVLGLTIGQRIPMFPSHVKQLRNETPNIRPNVKPAHTLVPPSHCAASSLAGPLARMAPLLWSHMTRRSQWGFRCCFLLLQTSTDNTGFAPWDG